MYNEVNCKIKLLSKGEIRGAKSIKLVNTEGFNICNTCVI